MGNEENPPTFSSIIADKLPYTMAISGLFLVGMGLYFYLFPEDEQSVTALIPAIIGLLTATVPTLIIIFLVIIVRIFKNFNVLSNSKYKKDLEKQRKEKEEERKNLC